MRVGSVVVGLAFVLTVSLLANTAWTQVEKKGGDKYAQKEGQMDPKEQAMMEAWMKYAMPGPFHAHLKPMVGTWSVASKFWMAPDTEPEIGSGTAEIKMILDGRFLSEDYSGMSSFGPFTGTGLTGYDNAKNKYVSTWIDSMGTGVMVSYGTCDASGKTITFIIKDYQDPIDGQTKQVRTVIRIINNDKHVMEMFEKVSGQKEFKNLEVVYTRKS